MKSRREFLRLVAVGSAAAMTGRASRAAAAAAAKSATKAAATAAVKTPAPAARGPAPRSAAVHTEIERQKKLTADSLKAIRKYSLPAGSPMGFTFKPLRPTAKGGR